MYSYVDLNFANIQDVLLHHGTRYKVCVHANAINITHEEWTQIIPAISACSDGVVVDTTPPSPGTVWIGWKEHSNYQVPHMSVIVVKDTQISCL